LSYNYLVSSTKIQINLISILMAQLVFPDLAEIKIVVKAAILELEAEKAKSKESDKLYTINEVRKRLGKAHSTIKKLVAKGMIKTTIDGLISEAAINEYLQKS